MPTTKRRTFLIGAAFALTVGVNATAALAQSIKLSVMIWDPAQRDGVQMAINAFEAANPNIKVSLEQVPTDQYYTKLDAALGAGAGPDVMWQSSRASYYVNGGALQPLNKYIAESGVSLT